jgi:surface antigen
MMTKLAAVAVAAALFPAAAAQAQWVGRSWDANRQLTYGDVDIIRNTAQREVHGRPADTVVAWANPASRNSGTITLLRKFVRRGIPCEQIEYRVVTPQHAQRTHRYVFNSCRQEDGSWTWPPGLCGSGANPCGAQIPNHLLKN